MAIPVILSRNGVSVYPATIPEAIIDPETGEPINLGSNMEYTINNTHADEFGNFTITAADLVAAPASHTHVVNDITGLQTALDNKANTDHTHDMVSSIVVNNASVSGNVRIIGTGNVHVARSSNTITISITPYTVDVGSTFMDGNTDNGNNPLPAGIFTGTRAQWEEFKATMPDNKRYIVFIRN